ncbi:ABC transporter substrate-binding protein, partial [Hyella patelloides]|uniref:ABC transporter substrate-binding protein n=1 Tax=Hyella patelloides TaxID=1982969 RepID=UPI001C9868EC
MALIGPIVYLLNEGKGESISPIVAENRKIKERISLGDKILITANSNVEKKAAVKAFADGNYETATEGFAASLTQNRNDPEALIYRNNAIAVASEDTYRIGISVPIGGNLGVAKEILRGVAQAQNEVNQAGGINGNLVTIEIANDDNNPELAEQVAKSFVKDRNILAVIGHNDSNVSIAAASIYQEKGLVMITPTSSADVIPTMGTYIFRTTPNTRALANTLAKYVVGTAHKTKIALCVDSQSEVSQSFKEEFTWSIYNLGGKVLPTQCDFSAPDFLPSSIVSRAISDGAEALLIAPSVKKINKAIQIAQV